MNVFICPNLVTLTIAKSIINKNKTHKYIVIYWPERTDPSLIKDNRYISATSIISLLKLLLHAFLFRNITTYIPHGKIGKLLNLLVSTSREVSIIDDGLDTLREHPKNIDYVKFASGTKFYTFDYKFDIANWTSRFDVIKTTELFSISELLKNKITLDEFDTVVIESPPAPNGELLKNEKSLGSVLFIGHPNPSKNKTNTKSMVCIRGNKASIERSILNYKGKIICGESMASLFAIMYSPPECKILLTVRKSEVDNLKKFISIANMRKNTTVMEITND